LTCVALSIFGGAQLLQRAVKAQVDIHAATGMNVMADNL